MGTPMWVLGHIQTPLSIPPAIPGTLLGAIPGCQRVGGNGQRGGSGSVGDRRGKGSGGLYPWVRPSASQGNPLRFPPDCRPSGPLNAEGRGCQGPVLACWLLLRGLRGTGGFQPPIFVQDIGGTCQVSDVLHFGEDKLRIVIIEVGLWLPLPWALLEGCADLAVAVASGAEPGAQAHVLLRLCLPVCHNGRLPGLDVLGAVGVPQLIQFHGLGILQQPRVAPYPHADLLELQPEADGQEQRHTVQGGHFRGICFDILYHSGEGQAAGAGEEGRPQNAGEVGVGHAQVLLLL
mmetsp:Transcript_21096/g.37773  ORF Transcript_21096/g.37773 Transcript_21096/m.37773 type:complete len:291 (+) Transcript_21096:335-1207(+)